MSRRIALPASADIRLCMVPPHHMVIVAPPPLRAILEEFLRPGVRGLFTFDPGVTWPNPSGCRYAEHYLKAGEPICFQFGALADALAFHKRLLREAVQ